MDNINISTQNQLIFASIFSIILISIIIYFYKQSSRGSRKRPNTSNDHDGSENKNLDPALLYLKFTQVQSSKQPNCSDDSQKDDKYVYDIDRAQNQYKIGSKSGVRKKLLKDVKIDVMNSLVEEEDEEISEDEQEEA